jgi:hypothetical protein
MKPTKEQLAQLLRDYPTWGEAAVTAFDLLLDIEGSLLAYNTDISEEEIERLRLKCREVLKGWGG